MNTLAKRLMSLGIRKKGVIPAFRMDADHHCSIIQLNLSILTRIRR